MYDRFTDRARKSMQLANQEAQRMNHEYVGTEHVLIGILKEGSGTASNLLRNLDIELNAVIKKTRDRMIPGRDITTMGILPKTPRLMKAIEFAIDGAKKLNHNYVGTEHLLLGLIMEDEGVASIVLKYFGLTESKIVSGIRKLLDIGHTVEIPLFQIIAGIQDALNRLDVRVSRLEKNISVAEEVLPYPPATDDESTD